METEKKLLRALRKEAVRGDDLYLSPYIHLEVNHDFI